MDWLEIAVETDEQAAEAVADLLQEITGRGVAIEDPALVEQYKNEGKWDAWDIPEASFPIGRVMVKAYLPGDEKVAALLEEIRLRIKREPLLRQVREEDWATAWKAYFKPVHISPNIVVKPSWERYNSAAGEIIIELDPGMAFGTGTHPTTAMCIRALEKTGCAGKRVLDAGTGSGILSIAAAKLGASGVTAVDIDETAVRAARENVAMNGVGDRVSVSAYNLLAGGSGENPAQGRFDIILANIIADVIIKLAPEFSRLLVSGGILITGGIIDDRRQEVMSALEKQELKPLETICEGGWVTIVCRGTSNLSQ